MSVLIGIDPATKGLHAVISEVDGSELEVASITLTKDKIKRCHEAMSWTRTLVESYAVIEDVYVYIEEPIVYRSAVSVIGLAQMNGAVISGAREITPYVYGVNNSRWKKVITGYGRVDKGGIALWVRDHWPDLYDMADGNQDLLDAGCINRYAEKMLERERRLRHKKLKGRIRK